MEWMDSEGMAGPLKTVEDWQALDLASMSQEQSDSFEDAFGNFFSKHTKQELYDEAVKRRFYLLPSNDPKGIVEDAQLAARNYWTEVEHPELGGKIKYPGAPYKFSQTPWHINHRAPLVGEHNTEIYEHEMGFSKSEFIKLEEANIV